MIISCILHKPLPVILNNLIYINITKRDFFIKEIAKISVMMRVKITRFYHLGF